MLCQDYFASAVNGLTNSPKISDLTRRDAFQLYILQNDEIVKWECSLADFCSVWDPLTRSLPKGVLKHDLSTFFRVNNLETPKLWGSIFFSKFLKVYVNFKNAKKYEEKMFRFQINAFELVGLKSLYCGQNTWSW